MRSLLVVIALTSCTFNVNAIQRDVRSESDAAPFTRLRTDLSTLGGGLDEGTVIVRGVDRANASAVVRFAGLLGAGDDEDAIVDGVTFEWIDAGGGTLELRVAYGGPTVDTVYIDEIVLELPLHTELELTVDAASADVAGLDGAMFVTAAGGSIRVRDGGEVTLEAGAGSIDVAAVRGVLMTDAGSILMDMSGDVQAHSVGGSVVGSFGLGGDISATSGSIDVLLTSALDRDLTLHTSSGSLRLAVPMDIGFQLEASAGGGSVIVDAGGVSHAGEDFEGPVGGGGTFVVRTRSESGSVNVVEGGGA